MSVEGLQWAILSSFWATFNTMGVAYFAIRISIVPPVPKKCILSLRQKNLLLLSADIFFSCVWERLLHNLA